MYVIAVVLVGSCRSVLQAEEETTTTTEAGPVLTGDPQKDYVHDPNLPRELRGYDLSDYPFYGRVPKPKTMNFTCDGLHDGFYASIPHKCQVTAVTLHTLSKVFLLVF